jgi:tetraacyldisaccharide 4'-kinase
MLEALARRIWNPAAGGGAAILSAGLAPFGALYGLGWWVREILPRSPARLPACVISVGNLTVGGTGKTPVTAEAARILHAAGISVAVLSRGYGRRDEAALVVVSDGRRVLADAAEAGDEPVMLARQLSGVPVIACADRALAGRTAVARFGAAALVLDDAFQNRRVVKDLEIVTVDGRRPFGNGRMLPAGPLRMPKAALARADWVILTKLGPDDDGGPARGILRALAPRAEFLGARTTAVGLRDLGTGKTLPLDALRRRRVAALCALAEPLAFTRLLEAEGMEVVDRFCFPDHHAYAPEDLARVCARVSSVEALVTTEKDAVKLEPAWLRDGPPVLSLVTRLAIDAPERLEKALRGAVERAPVGRTQA